MDDLLSRVLDAHGGLERWSKVNTLAAQLTVGGPFWGAGDSRAPSWRRPWRSTPAESTPSSPPGSSPTRA
jgi:hypothetical protein